MYRTLEYLHILGAIFFFLGHGATAFAMFELRKAKEATVARVLMRLRYANVVLAVTWGGFFVMAGTGIWLGFLGNFWRTGWLWGSIVVFLVIWGVMGYWGRGYFDSIERALDPQGGVAKKAKNPETRSLEEVLASGRTWMLTIAATLPLSAIF